MGFTTESRNYTKLVATAAYGATDVSTRGLASDMYKNMVDNGFKLIYHNGGGSPAPDTTNLWKATEVVFEPKSPTDDPINFVDPLGLTQTWRIGFAVQGFPNTTADGNELVAYLGTKETLTSTGIDRVNSFPVILLQGGSNAGDTRITATKTHGYRLTITTRGVAMLIWNPKNIEDMNTMGLLCVQRPVKSDGSTLTDGFAPVFAVHNTDPMTKGRLSQSGRFFRTVVRERDVNLPQKSTAAVVSKNRHATGAIQIRSMTPPQGGALQHIFDINGVKVTLGTPQGQASPDNFGVLINNPTNGQYSTDVLVNAATHYANELAKMPHKGLQDLTIFSSGPNILFYAKEPGTGPNTFTFSKLNDASNTYTIITPTNGTLSGGGGKATAAKGTIDILNIPPQGNSNSKITLGTGGGVTISFISGVPASNTALEVTVGASAADTATNLKNRLVYLQTVYSQLQGVSFDISASNSSRIVVSNESLASGSLWTQSKPAGLTEVSLSATLTGGNTNYASGQVNFVSIPTAGSILEINKTPFTFVYGIATGDNQVSLGDVLSPYNIDQVLNALLAKLLVHPSIDVQKGLYSIEPSANLTSPYVGRLNIQHATPGLEGNYFTLYTTSSSVDFGNVGVGFYTTLTGGAGYAPSTETNAYPDEISELTGKFGSTMYRLPNVWNTPVTTDTGEYVLVFPFGFCTSKVAYTEEMDMIAISKGAAYQGVQNVNINVYSANRTYTSYNSNRATITGVNDYVRVFILTSGGGI